MLVLGRKEGEVVRIHLAEGVSPSLSVGELFSAGPIEITVTRIVGGTVRLGIQADRRLRFCAASYIRRDRRGRRSY